MAFSPYSWVIPETKGLLVFNGLENYRELFQYQEWWHSLWVSAKFTAGVLPTSFILAMFTAVMISKVAHPRWAGFFRIVSYLPVVLPISSAMLLWRNLYEAEYGYINYFLKTALYIKEPPNWMRDPRWTLLSAVLPTVWKGFGHNTLLFLIGVYSINRELYEAAEIDGAGGAWWSEWGGPYQAALTTGLYAYALAFGRADMRMGLGASASLILGLISMLLSGIIFKTVRVERA